MNDTADVFYGYEQIAKHLNATPRQVEHWKTSHALPTFRIGRTICARRCRLAAWIVEQEKAGADE